MEIITNNLLLPALSVIVSVVLLILKSYAERLTKSIEYKNKLETIKMSLSVKAHLIKEISVITQSAVGSNMQLANKIKRIHGHINDKQKAMLNNNAKKIIYTAVSTVDENEISVSKLFGGKENLENFIDSLIERYVYEYKVEENNNECKDPYEYDEDDDIVDE